MSPFWPLRIAFPRRIVEYQNLAASPVIRTGRPINHIRRETIECASSAVNTADGNQIEFPEKNFRISEGALCEISRPDPLHLDMKAGDVSGEP
jgi:hypothetical protein